MNTLKYASTFGLILGSFAALLHGVWATLVATGNAQSWLNYIFGFHFLNNPFIVQPFSFVHAIGLIGMVFVVGYIYGFIFGLLWRLLKNY